MVHKLYKRTAFSLGLLVAFIGSFLVGSGKTFGSLTKFTDGANVLPGTSIAHADTPGDMTDWTSGDNGDQSDTSSSGVGAGGTCDSML